MRALEALFTLSRKPRSSSAKRDSAKLMSTPLVSLATTYSPVP